MIGSSGASFVTGAMMFAPITGWAFMIARSSLVRRSGLLSTLSGTPIFPMSWSSPPHSRASSSFSDSRITRPMSTEICCTRMLWPDVNLSLRVHRLRQARHRLGEHLAHLDDLVEERLA